MLKLNRLRKHFPFRGLWFGVEQEIVGYDAESNHYIIADGGGYVWPSDVEPLDAEPLVEVPQEPTPIFATFRENGPDLKKGRVRGYFAQAPLTPRERLQRADSTQLWLRSRLQTGPKAAEEILRQARLDGVAIRSLYVGSWLKDVCRYWQTVI